MGFLGISSVSLARLVARVMTLERFKSISGFLKLFDLFLRILKVEFFTTTIVDIAHILVFIFPIFKVLFHIAYFWTSEAFASILGILCSQLACNLAIIDFFSFIWRWCNRHTVINISFFNHNSIYVILDWLVLRFLVSNWNLVCSFCLLDDIILFWVWTSIFWHFNILNFRELFEFLEFFGINSRIIACANWLLFHLKSGVIGNRALRILNTRLPLWSFIPRHRRLTRFLIMNSFISWQILESFRF